MKMHLTALGLVIAASLLGANAAASPTRAGATPSTAGPYTGNIAFVSVSQGYSLNVIPAAGGEVAQVSPPGMSVSAYAWSPNAKWIAYIDANTGSLWLARPDGSGRKLLLAGSTLASSFFLSWSPAGKKIAVISAGPYAQGSLDCGGSIYVVPIDGAPPRKLRGTGSSCDGLAWSPQGDEIAYGDHGVWVIHPNGSGRRRIARRGWGWVAWSADGKQVAFALALSVHPLFGLYNGIGVVDADGRDFHFVTRNADNEYPAAWSPTGHLLLYGRAHKAGTYVIDANGRNDRQVTTDSPMGSELPALAWSPDGNSIVYAVETGALYEIAVDGSDKVQLTSPGHPFTSPGSGDLDPSWAPAN